MTYWCLSCFQIFLKERNLSFASSTLFFIFFVLLLLSMKANELFCIVIYRSICASSMVSAYNDCLLLNENEVNRQLFSCAVHICFHYWLAYEHSNEIFAWPNSIQQSNSFSIIAIVVVLRQKLISIIKSYLLWPVCWQATIETRYMYSTRYQVCSSRHE
jgi:hypothetical protein